MLVGLCHSERGARRLLNGIRCSREGRRFRRLVCLAVCCMESFSFEEELEGMVGVQVEEGHDEECYIFDDVMADDEPEEEEEEEEEEEGYKEDDEDGGGGGEVKEDVEEGEAGEETDDNGDGGA